jgi:hypothetical protein
MTEHKVGTRGEWLAARKELQERETQLADLSKELAPLLDAARTQAGGRGGHALLDTFDRFNRSLADAPALRKFVEEEREVALRIITSSSGKVQPHFVAKIAGLIEDQARADTYELPVDPATLGYAIVRLVEGLPFQRRRGGDAR